MKRPPKARQPEKEYKLKLPPRFLIKTFGTGSYYVIDRLIVYAFILLTITATITFAATYGLQDNIYLTCHGPGSCINPLYGQDCHHLTTSILSTTTALDQRICDTPTLYPGYTYGNPPAPLVENAPAALILSFLLAITLNHYLWNVGGEATMNVKILVTPHTDKGLAAINQHFKEQGAKEKLFMRAAKVKQEQLKDGSLLLTIPTTVTLTNATWEELARSTMKTNGANPEDYTITVNTE